LLPFAACYRGTDGPREPLSAQNSTGADQAAVRRAGHEWKAGSRDELRAVRPAVALAVTEPVKKGEMLMLMLHGEKGGSKAGIFEYSLGAKEDGPVKVGGKLVMRVITAK
jgi:hypothetical protein